MMVIRLYTTRVNVYKIRILLYNVTVILYTTCVNVYKIRILLYNVTVIPVFTRK